MRTMSVVEVFAEIIKQQHPLAPLTTLKLGGPAQFFAQPTSIEQLSGLLRHCQSEKVPVRVLGGGSNLLVRDEGVRGLVLRLSEPAFTSVAVADKQVRAGAGAALSALISETARHGLAGLESLIGIPGTVAGALRSNAGSRFSFITQYVREVEIMDGQGRIQTHGRDDLRLDESDDLPADSLITAAAFELEPDKIDSILKRMRKFWIHRKAHQPLSFQASGRMFKDPRAMPAEQLIEQAELVGTRVGGTEISDRHANYIVVHSGATGRDVLRLIDLVRGKIAAQFGQHLELALVVW